jgi:hypothetical protein
MVNLRTFFQTAITLASLVGAVGIAGIPARAFAADSDQPQYYELRVYTTKSEQQQKLVSDYWQNAAVPAYNRMGIQPVGVFTELQDSATNKIYVLIPCDSLDVFAAIPSRLASDATYQAAAADYMALPKSNPAYERIESSLNVAFESMKKLAAPPSSADKSPVFFSQTLVGSQMPNLVYMVSGENMDEHKKHWKGFSEAPVWKKLSGDPQYKDNVSRVISIFLKRTPASQI